MKYAPFTSYALLGSGRVARNLEFYLNHLRLPVTTWSRHRDPEFKYLDMVIGSASHVLLAVSDPALIDLSKRILSSQVAVHFSGTASMPGVYCAHPLMTFGPDIQDLNWYQSIPFVIDRGVDFAQILPGLPNPSVEMNPEHRAYYHALCVLAGNSAFLLWQTIAREFAQRLGLPASILGPFLHQTVTNALQADSPKRFTGPVAREDWQTVHAHLDVLSDQPMLLSAYRQFLKQAAIAGQNIPEALL